MERISQKERKYVEDVLDNGFRSSCGSKYMNKLEQLFANKLGVKHAISFVNGTSDVVLDSTYPIYLFKFINVQPATDGKKFSVGFRDRLPTSEVIPSDIPKFEAEERFCVFWTKSNWSPSIVPSAMTINL